MRSNCMLPAAACLTSNYDILWSWVASRLMPAPSVISPAECHACTTYQRRLLPIVNYITSLKTILFILISEAGGWDEEERLVMQLGFCYSDSQEMELRGFTSRSWMEQVSKVLVWVVVWLGSYGVGGRGWGVKQPVVPALILFGDSTVDVGNNNFLPTLVKSDFLPYGRDFDTKMPTGRFTDGRMVCDFVATRLGLPMSLPYLHPNATGQNLVHGINFASAASGYLNTTSAFLNVMPASKQLQMFEQYKIKLAGVVGVEKASSTISEALYFISAGSNDYILNYFVSPSLQHRYSTAQFNSLVMSKQTEFVRNLHKAGARKIGILGFPPIGCIPAQITIFGALGQQTCVEEQNAVALAYNKQLQAVIPKWQASLPGSQLLYLDAYSVLYEIFNNPSKYGIIETRRACCGHGFLSTAEFCNPKTEGTCSDASKYVFFDSLHPTQAVYKRIAEDYERKLFSFLKFNGEY